MSRDRQELPAISRAGLELLAPAEPVEVALAPAVGHELGRSLQYRPFEAQQPYFAPGQEKGR